MFFNFIYMLRFYFGNKFLNFKLVKVILIFFLYERLCSERRGVGLVWVGIILGSIFLFSYNFLIFF